MNAREAKIIALEIGHLVLDQVDVAEILREHEAGYNEADIAKIKVDLAAISARLHERYLDLLRTGRRFQSPFEQALPTKTGESCPECNEGQILVRQGKYGRFQSCSRFPDCRWRAPLVVGTCPKCGSDLIEKAGARGVFWGCASYPECSYTQDPEMPQ